MKEFNIFSEVSLWLSVADRVTRRSFKSSITLVRDMEFGGICVIGLFELVRTLAYERVWVVCFVYVFEDGSEEISCFVIFLEADVVSLM